MFCPKCLRQWKVEDNMKVEHGDTLLCGYKKCNFRGSVKEVKYSVDNKIISIKFVVEEKDSKTKNGKKSWIVKTFEGGDIK